MRSNLIFTLAISLFAILAFVFPSYFLTLGSIETKQFIFPLLMLIMFGMGTHLSLTSLLAEWRRPKAIGLGLGCQFLLMPLLGFLLATLSNLPAEVAAGIVLVGCSPSGLASNVMCFIAKANLALSVSLTTAATLIAPFLTPLLMQFFADEFVQIDALAMFYTMLKLVVIPVTAGMLINALLPTKWHRLLAIMPLVSMVGIIVIVAIIIANGQQALASIGWLLVLLVIAHNLAGFVVGYISAKVAKLDEASCRALAFEVGMQNSGLASGIALSLSKVNTMGLAAALFSAVQNITGSILAALWSSDKKGN